MSFSTWKQRVRRINAEAFALFLACRDPRTPWYAKAFALCVVAYAFSPIDLIPDFIPVLGYLDDLLITPGGLWLAIRLIPPEVLEEARGKVSGSGVERSVRYIGLAMILVVWIVILISALYLVKSLPK